VTDLNMPFLDGFELIRWIRERRLTTRIVAMSGAGDALGAALELGADRALAKPFAGEELIDSLQAAHAGVSGRPLSPQ
jgi:DNA-binding response OmpR family regulator